MRKLNDNEMMAVDGGKKYYAICDCRKTYGGTATLAGIWLNLGLRFHSCAICNESKRRGIGYFVTVYR